LQIRYVAKVIHDASLKDSVIFGQDNQIENLKLIIEKKGVVIDTLKMVVKNDSILKQNLLTQIDNEKELGEINVGIEEQKKKNNKIVAIIAIALNIVKDIFIVREITK
jgi:hypothetical protein